MGQKVGSSFRACFWGERGGRGGVCCNCRLGCGSGHKATGQNSTRKSVCSGRCSMKTTSFLPSFLQKTSSNSKKSHRIRISGNPQPTPTLTPLTPSHCVLCPFPCTGFRIFPNSFLSPLRCPHHFHSPGSSSNNLPPGTFFNSLFVTLSLSPKKSIPIKRRTPLK